MKFTKGIKKDLVLIFLVFLFLSALLLRRLWSNGSFIPEWDEAFHLKISFYFFEAFMWQNWNWIRDLLTTDAGGIYPPLYRILIALGYFFFGVSPSASIYVNIPFILILMISIYGLGYSLGNKNAGLVAAILTPILPVFLTIQERADINYASVALFIASFWIMFATNGFTNRKYSIIFGVIVLLELLTKWPFAVPSLPILFYAIANFNSRKLNRKEIIRNWLTISIIAIPGIVWYLFSYKTIIDGLAIFWNPTGFQQLIWDNPQRFSFNNFVLYLFTFPVQGSGVGIFVLLFFIGSFFVRNISTKLKYVLYSVIVSFAVLTYMNDKSPFYTTYAYPILMVTSAKAVLEIKNKLKRNFLTMTFFLAVLINLFISQTKPSTYEEVSLDFNEIKLHIFPSYSTKFIKDEWPTYKTVYRELNEQNCAKGVLFFPDNRFLNFPNLDYFLNINSIKIKSEPAYNFYNPAIDKTFDLRVIDLFDCVVTKSGYPGIFSNTKIVKEVSDYLSSSAKYKKITFEAPDDSSILLYIRK